MLTEIELERRAVQIELDSGRTMPERNALGQYATAPRLADEILEYAKTKLPNNSNVRFLDPAFGTGSFYSSLLKTFPKERIAGAVGYEIDERVALQSERLWRDTSLKLRAADFTRTPLPTTEGERANLIICNPPYVRHHHLTAENKARLQNLSQTVAGAHFSGLAGLYCYFLALCHAWMTEGGIAGWLIPSEFMDVNYGREIKQYLLSRVTLLRIHRYDPKELQFDDALVSSAVVWFTKKLPPSDHQIEFTYGGSLEKPKLRKFISSSEAEASNKWTALPFSKNARKSSSETVKLSELFTVKRGLATGANEFFILSPEQTAEYKLPKEFLTPILPSPRFLQTDRINADGAGNPLLERKLYLLNCSLPETVVREQYPSLWEYLQRGVQDGISERYLCKSRKPWYAQENRPAAPLLCTYMGRGRKDERPFRFILNRSQATAANVYLMIYPKISLFNTGADDWRFIESVWKQLNNLPQGDVTDEGRIYGGGLHKIEPKELGNVQIRIPSYD